MKANELSTTEKLANLKTASFKHKYENLLSLLHIFFLTRLNKYCKKIRPTWHHLIKPKAILIIFQVTAESISQSDS